MSTPEKKHLQSRALLSESAWEAFDKGYSRHLISERNANLGNLIGSERALFYCHIVYRMLLFRREHELEPLHEDLYRAVHEAQETVNGSSYLPDQYVSDINSLHEWKLITVRLEKERIRGYKDTRRTKFRYGLTCETIRFLVWLEERLLDDIEERIGDARDLLEEVAGTIRELARFIRSLHILLESPYFYREDNEIAFNFLKRHRSEFVSFFQSFFGWVLVIDNKCARIYKERWYNASITESNRDCFNFTKRDECIAFMIILEFFEHQLDENDMSIAEKENLRFRFGDLLEFCTRRFAELFSDNAERYTPEYLRAQVLRRIFPVLERYRFLRKVPPPQGDQITEEQTIFEALPAMYHYNSAYLHNHFDEIRQSVRSGVETYDDSDAENAVEDTNATCIEVDGSMA